MTQKHMVTHEDSLFQIYMTSDDIKALKLAVLGSDAPAEELILHCNNIIDELDNHLKEAGFKPPIRTTH